MLQTSIRTCISRVILIVLGSVLFASCGHVPTEPGRVVTPNAARYDATPGDSTNTCRSGYVVIDGHTVCAGT
jgi:hypothetical protein